MQFALSRVIIFLIFCQFLSFRSTSSQSITLPKDILTKENFQWKDLTESELNNWYTPLDLCTLNSSRRADFPQDIRANDCRHLSFGSRRLHCGVGMGSNNHACNAPYQGRPHFKRGISGFTDHSKTPILNTMKELLRTNTSLVFIGDSTMRQKLNALDCELMREDHKARIQGPKHGILPCYTLLKIFLPKKAGTLDLHGVAMGPSAYECLKGGVGKTDPVIGTFENAREVVNRITKEENRSVLIVANMGLWFNDEDPFQRVLPTVLDWLVSVVDMKDKNNVVAWHETMSQHFINEIGSGYFFKPLVDDQEVSWKDGRVNLTSIDTTKLIVPNCCSSISNTTFLADWRNDLVRVHLSKNSRSDKIHYLPFADMTRDVADMHVCHPDYIHDCTHYCFWPLLWQPFWHQIEKLSYKLSAPSTNAKPAET